MNRAAYLLALCYILFYFPSGLLKSYLSQFLVNSGFSYSVAGLIVGSTFLVKIFITPTITLLAEHTHSKHLLNILFAILATVSVIVVSISQSVFLLAAGIGLLMASRSYFQNILESTAATVHHHGAQGGYGQVRFAGSLSVAIGTATMAGLSTLGLVSDQIFIWILTLSSLFFTVVFIGASEKENPQKEITPSSFKPSRLKRSAFLIFTAAALIIGAQGAYYSIGTPWLITMGLSGSQIFIAWTIGFIAEAIAFRYSNALMSRHYCSVIPMVALCFIFRAFLIWDAPGLTQAVISFVLQGITFSIPHAAFVNSIRHFFSSRYSATGTSLYFAVAHGIGITIFSGTSGLILDLYGGLAWALPAVSGVTGCVVWMVSYKTSGIKTQLIHNPSSD
jgi:predicted MFS family arabinose efflux permease